MPPLIQVATDLSTRARAPGGNIPSPQGTGLESAFSSVGANLKSMSDNVGRLADRAAVDEGRDEGRQAGLDPEFRTRPDRTLFSDAFNKAGLDVAGSRLSVSLDQGLDQAYEKHKGSPQALGKALDDVIGGVLGGAPEELRPKLQIAAGSKRVAFMRQATREMTARMVADQQAALQTEVSTMTRSLHQIASAAGLDEEGDNAVGARMQLLRDTLNRKGLDGRPLVGPKQAAAILQASELEAASARLHGALGRMPDLPSKERFVKELEDDFQNSRGLAAKYDFSQFRGVLGSLRSDVTRARTEHNVKARGVLLGVERLSEAAAAGLTPKPEEIAQVRASVNALGDPAIIQRMAEAESDVEFEVGLNRSTPIEIDAWVQAQRGQIGDNSSLPLPARQRVQARIERAEQRVASMRTQLQTDPYSWAEKTGRIAGIPALDIGSPDASRPQAFENQTGQRVALHAELEQAYGMKLPLLRPLEKRQLMHVMSKGPEATLAVTTALVEGFGAAAPQALSELSKDAPELAALGSLVAERGDMSAARDAAVGISLQRVPDYAKRRRLPEKQVTQPVVASVYGGAFMALPQAKVAIEEMAGAIYEARAARRNLGSFDPQIYREALSQAAGEVEHNGVKFGGIAAHRTGYFGMWSREVIVPGEIRQDRFDDVIDMIEDADLTETGHRFRYADGKPATAEQIRSKGTLVSVGGGKYMIAMGDPATSPRWLQDEQGREARLDLKRLVPRLRRREPGYFIGGR